MSAYRESYSEGEAIVRQFKERSPGRPGRLIQSSAAFVKDFVPPDYLWDGILQRRFFYTLTGMTGGGKTAIALLLAMSVALGTPLCGRTVTQGSVIYLAGENPDDIRMRWIAMAQHFGFNIDAIDVNFIPGAFSLDELEARVRAEVEALGGVALVIVDTSAAFFPGNEENSNVQLGNHARRLRRLTTLKGEPTVLANCHPVKNATADNLLPRGGGSFIAEGDGNLTCAKVGTTTTFHWQGKFRGPDFEPMAFELLSVTADGLKDSKGRNIPTVVAKALSDAEHQEKVAALRCDDDAVLILLLVVLRENKDAPSLAGIAETLQWFTKTGQPYKSRAFRAVDRLHKDKLVAKERGSPVLTAKGEKAAKKAQYNRDAAGAIYG